MRYNTILLSAFILLFAVYAPVLGNEEAQLIESIGKGSVNWSKGFIRATGIGAPPDWAYGKPQARPLALTKARMVAYRNLLKVAQSIRVDTAITIKETIDKDTEVAAQFDSMIRGAEVIREEYRLNGTVEVTVQMSMTGGFAQLILPGDILHVESVKTIRSASKTAGSGSKSKPDFFTGLVVDARGLAIQPVIALKILNENGKEVYGPAYVSREHAVQQGMCGYFTNIQRAIDEKRVGKKPLVVKGIKTQGLENSYIIISNDDAAILKSTPANLSFLRKCFVAVIVD